MLQLPVSEIRSHLKQTLENHSICIVSAPAGSGKSTLIPQFLLDDGIAGDKSVFVLQPRRIAARMLAGFIAQQRNVRLGEEVGYKVRLENLSSKNTKILFVTEGILLNRLFQNDILEETSIVVFDEFHERHIETDLSLALALQLQKQKRPDLKIVIMSATLDLDQLKTFLGQEIPIIESAGRTFPVEIIYKQTLQTDPIWESAAKQAEGHIKSTPNGSALIFMPGSFEIRKTVEALQKRSSLALYKILPLHGSLKKEEQEQAVKDDGPKIIVTTNVAETSLTIPNVKLVVDSGLARISRFDAKRGINTLFIENISNSSADQRAGRAGRVAPGACVRLWSEFENSNRVPKIIPEIHRIDLSEIVLNLMVLGYRNPNDFPWLEKPEPDHLESALKLLHNLGAIDRENKITKLGHEMAGWNVHPRFARMLIKAGKLDCLPSACVIVAIEQSSGFLNKSKDPVLAQEQEYTFGNPSSDLLYEYNAWIWAKQRDYKFNECSRFGINVQAARQIELLAAQILNKCPQRKQVPSELLSYEESTRLRECIFTGFIDFLAIRHKGNSPVCQMMFGKSAKIHPQSIVQQAKLMVATELEESRFNNSTQLFLKKVSEVEEIWMEDLISDQVNIDTETIFDQERKRVTILERHIFNELEIFRTYKECNNNEQASALLAELILKNEIAFEKWDEEVEHFIRRANFAARNAPHYGIPEIDEDARHFIIQQSIYKCKSTKDLEKCNVWNALRAWFTSEQLAAIDYLAPVSVNLPHRKYPVKLRYDEKGDAVLSETVQALYDCPPVMLCESKIQVVYEILAPSRRPVQITRDLEQFWKSSYLDVRKELKGRYPKHEWR